MAGTAPVTDPSTPAPSTPAPSTPAAAPGAGWHPDPSGRFRQRWWDGTEWTGYAIAGDPDDVRWDPQTVAVPIETTTQAGGIGYGVAGFAIGALLSLAVIHLLPDDAGLVEMLLLPSAALWLGLLGGCIAAHNRYGTGTFDDDFKLKFKWIDIAFGIVGSIAGRAMTISAASPIPLPSTRLRDVHDAPQRIADGGAWVALFVVICIGAPLFEELLFRGLLQPRLVARSGPVVGIVSASALFGAAHLLGWSGPLTFGTAWAIAFGGMALGTLRYYTGRMGPSILAHSLFNLQVFLLLYFAAH